MSRHDVTSEVVSERAAKPPPGSKWCHLAKDIFIRDCVIEHMRTRESEHGVFSFEEKMFFMAVQEAWRPEQPLSRDEKTRILMSMAKMTSKLKEDQTHHVLYISNWISKSEECAIRRRKGHKRPAKRHRHVLDYGMQ